MNQGNQPESRLSHDAYRSRLGRRNGTLKGANMQPKNSLILAAINSRRWWQLLLLVLTCVATTPATPVAARGYEPLPEAASREYLLDVGDEIRVSVSGLPALSDNYVIGSDGQIALPLIDGVTAQGASTGQLQETIAEQLRNRQVLLKPSVSVQLTKGKPFYVLGEVKKPGEYLYRPGMTVLTAIATAGGFTFRAKQDKVLVTRSIGGKLVTGTVTSERQILPGDTINVRESWF